MHDVAATTFKKYNLQSWHADRLVIQVTNAVLLSLEILSHILPHCSPFIEIISCDDLSCNVK